MVPPDGVKGEALQKNCSNLSALLVDERPLVGCTKLVCSNMERKAVNFHGAAFQLLSLWVMAFNYQMSEIPLFTLVVAKHLLLSWSLVWRKVRVAVTLKTILRLNQSQAQLRDVLMSMREHKTTQQQAKWLHQFQWDSQKAT